MLISRTLFINNTLSFCSALAFTPYSHTPLLTLNCDWNRSSTSTHSLSSCLLWTFSNTCQGYHQRHKSDIYKTRDGWHGSQGFFPNIDLSPCMTFPDGLSRLPMVYKSQRQKLFPLVMISESSSITRVLLPHCCCWAVLRILSCLYTDSIISVRPASSACGWNHTCLGLRLHTPVSSLLGIPLPPSTLFLSIRFFP